MSLRASVVNTIRDLIDAKGNFTLSEVNQALCDNGILIPEGSTVVRTTVYEMKNSGLLQRCGRGEYQAADEASIMARTIYKENVGKAADMLDTVFDLLDNVNWKLLSHSEHTELIKVWQELNALHEHIGIRISNLV